MPKVHIFGNKRSKWDHESLTVTDWKKVPFSYYTDTHVSILTTEVIKNDCIYVFLRLQSGRFVPLPLRNYSTHAYTVSIDAVVKPHILRLIWTYLDIRGEVLEPQLHLVIFTIQATAREKYAHLNFRNYDDLQPVFGLPA
ncbi:MAG: hypothetical protein A3D92_25450 [Bacteroidetes bacterium RIFCSPHIGHO2_02_FULL_44_7]|nr:MAG: hypothetical protein A3D92_25450 [Bacteroidetes bacterium RIFCSPHIGHO2_02_FULL_44_7]